MELQTISPPPHSETITARVYRRLSVFLQFTLGGQRDNRQRDNSAETRIELEIH